MYSPRMYHGATVVVTFLDRVVDNLPAAAAMSNQGTEYVANL